MKSDLLLIDVFVCAAKSYQNRLTTRVLLVEGCTLLVLSEVFYLVFWEHGA